MNKAGIFTSNFNGFLRNIFPVIIFLNMIFFSSFAQSRIHGKIIDSTGKPIVNANVLLLNSKDSVLVKVMLNTEK